MNGSGRRNPRSARLGIVWRDVRHRHQRAADARAMGGKDPRRHADGDRRRQSTATRGRDGARKHVRQFGAPVRGSQEFDARAASSQTSRAVLRARPHGCASSRRLGHVVGHEHHGLSELALDALKLALQLRARVWIERAERLVHQQRRAARRPARVRRRRAAAARRTAHAGDARRTRRAADPRARAAPPRGRAGAATASARVEARCARSLRRSDAGRARSPAARSRFCGAAESDPTRACRVLRRAPRRTGAAASGWSA